MAGRFNGWYKSISNDLPNLANSEKKKPYSRQARRMDRKNVRA